MTYPDSMISEQETASNDPARDENFMWRAIEAAREAESHGDVPIGAVIVQGDRVLSVAGNRREVGRDPTAHAELIAIREASSVLKRAPTASVK